MPRSRKGKKVIGPKAESRDQTTPEPMLPTPAATPKKAAGKVPMSVRRRAAELLGTLDEEEEEACKKVEERLKDLEAEEWSKMTESFLQ